MRLLAALLAGSGAAWITGILLANPYLVAPDLSPTLIIAACYVVVAAGVVLATRRTTQLPGRLVGLWALLIVIVGCSLVPLGVSWPLAGAALLYGTITFALWAAPPLLVFSFAATLRRRPEPITPLPSSAHVDQR